MKKNAPIFLLTNVFFFIKFLNNRISFLISMDLRKTVNCRKDQQQQQHFCFGGYKLRYCEFGVLSNNNLKYNMLFK